MPKEATKKPKPFVFVEDYGDGLSLMYREKQNGKAVYYARFYMKHSDERKGKLRNSYQYKSLRIPYLGEDKYTLSEAEKKARMLHQDHKRRSKIGDPRKTSNIEKVIDEYKEYYWKKATINKKLEDKGKLPTEEVENGRGYWTIARAVVLDAQFVKMKPFWAKYKLEDITLITENDLDKFDGWALSEYEWSPSHRKRHIVTLRMLWRYAKKRGYVDRAIIEIKRGRIDAKPRQRRNMQKEDYERIVKHCRAKFEEGDYAYNEDGATIGNSQYRRDLAYQFFLWIVILANSGCRPPTGKVSSTMFRWDDLRDENDKRPTSKSKQWMIKRNEKGHNYYAVIMPTAIKYVQALEKLQKERGVKSEYLFAHTFDNEPLWKKGDPLKSFKTQWNTMMKHLAKKYPAEDYYRGTGTMQKDKLVMSSLRGFYITMRLLYNPELRLEDLAESCGTSARMIQDHYWDFKTSKVYEEITKGAWKPERRTMKASYSKDGYIKGTGI